MIRCPLFRKLSGLLLVLLLFLIPFQTYAWSEHGLMTGYVLKDIEWLKDYKNIVITPYTYADEDKSIYNPKFVIKFKEGNIGETTNAYTILSIYVDEPDWDMDTELKLSRFQFLTGDSQGYRHQRYVAFGGLLRAGVAHRRVSHFYNLSKLAFSKGDDYWGFRFLARTMHYIQDITQPQHTLPAPNRIVLKEIIDIKGFTIMCVNHHSNLEDYQGIQIINVNPSYTEILIRSDVIPVRNPYKTTLIAASRSRKLIGKLWDKSEIFFGKEISSKKLFTFDLERVKKGNFTPDELKKKEALDKVILEGLKLLSGYSKGFLNFARKDLSF